MCRTLQIRAATVEDAECIGQLVCALTQSHIGPTLGEGGLAALLARMDAASTRERMREGYPHWVALDGEAIVGVCVVQPPSHLFHLFVRDERQRSGIGRKLLCEGLNAIERISGARHATVNASHNAIDAYQRFGFEADGEPVDRNGVRYQPMVLREHAWP